MDDFERFEHEFAGTDYIDVENPLSGDALRYASEQAARLVEADFPDYRHEATMPEFPFPTRDNIMLRYLIKQAASVNEEQGSEMAIVWLAVHAWFEGALAALDQYAAEGE